MQLLQLRLGAGSQAMSTESDVLLHQSVSNRLVVLFV